MFECDEEPGTVTLAVALPKFGVLAVIATDPAASPVSVTVTLVAPVANVTVGGMLAMFEFVVVRLAVNPGGAGPERFRVRVPVDPALMVMFAGEKKLVPVVVITCT